MSGREITLEFRKIVGEGKALGRADGKVVFCYGVLPGETARVRVKREKRNWAEADLLEVVTPSPSRREPREDHYLSCSPWQVMDYALQAETKKALIEDLFYQTLKETIKLDFFRTAKAHYGYRTKIEYSFTEEDGRLELAFHKRGSYGEKYALRSGCALISDNTNAAALAITEELRRRGAKAADLKSLIIREAKDPEGRIAALFVKSRDLDVTGLALPPGLNGFTAAWSNPLSPVSQADEVIFSSGDDHITETLPGGEFSSRVKLSYGFDCFFQNNMELFAQALDEMGRHCFKCGKMVDLYSGVGAIGLSLRQYADKVYAVESSPAAVRYAAHNALENGASNFEAACGLSEKTGEEALHGAEILLVDPPRAGLHIKAVKSILAARPKRIIYLSCNPITQGRDAAFFLERYKLSASGGFDFYPNTPHAETMMVFDLR
ncbi:MAG: TRAM domain-containing protein [Elusimicrobiales bacterium]|jgi:23S rRNA (uracil1939-C5)-methyltransferase|nr:TRAM domain-containing protein [Elusimicrobiales bacterium]